MRNDRVDFSVFEVTDRIGCIVVIEIYTDDEVGVRRIWFYCGCFEEREMECVRKCVVVCDMVNKLIRVQNNISSSPINRLAWCAARRAV